MGVLRPVKMRKIGLLALKSDRHALLATLHDLGVAQVENASPATLRLLEADRGDETQRTVGDEALRFRGLKAALPRQPTGTPRAYRDLAAVLAAARAVPASEVDGPVGELEHEDDRLQTERHGLEETRTLVGKLSFFPGSLAQLDLANSLVFYVEAAPEVEPDLGRWLGADPGVTLIPAPVPGRYLLMAPKGKSDVVARAGSGPKVRLTPIPRLEGSADEEGRRLARRLDEIDRRRGEIRQELDAISRRWYAEVAALDEALAIENRLFELYAKLGTSDSAFALEAWIPARDLDRARAAIEGSTGGKVHFYEIPTDEEPPTMMENPAGVRRFEFFIRFYSLPQASEWDPTLVFAIVFPIFFGFMLGDWGYGLVILGISLWMIAGFPGARHLPRAGRNFVKLIMGPKGMQQLAYALLPGCLIAIGLGLYFDQFFGFAVLHDLFGYVAPIDPKSNVGILLLFAGYVGLGMVTLGFLFGALKEYFHHHRGALIGKVGGILFAWGIAFLGLAVIHGTDGLSNVPFDAYLGLIVVGLAMMFGEGLQHAMMGLIEVVSHILSYTRLVGILLASVILAYVIDLISTHLLAKSVGAEGIAFIVLGLLILVIGQAFNVVLGVFEPGIQGARLIFVEYFSKFYTGNGKPFRPLGSRRVYTRASGAAPEPSGTAAPPAGAVVPAGPP